MGNCLFKEQEIKSTSFSYLTYKPRFLISFLFSVIYFVSELCFEMRIIMKRGKRVQGRNKGCCGVLCGIAGYC